MPDPRLLTEDQIQVYQHDLDQRVTRGVIFGEPCYQVWVARCSSLLDHIYALEASIPARERTAYLGGAKAAASPLAWDYYVVQEAFKKEALRCYPDPPKEATP